MGMFVEEMPMRKIWLSVLVGGLGWTAPVQAQVDIRAPLVRVQVGPGVAVRAPFVNLYVPPEGGVIFGPLGPPACLPPPPPPPVVDPNIPPPPPPNRAPTLDEFARSFQPKAGAYDVVLQNPLTQQPTNVHFTLPEGSPRRVIVHRREIEFFYAPRHFVRIEFDRDGAQVVTR
jgi:hypothetical protein